MLKQASIQQIRAGELTRADGYIVICMHFYPRGLPKTKRDEYLSCLATGRELIQALKGKEKKIGHDEAFAAVHFEEKLTFGPQAMLELKRVASLSEKKDVYLVCQCALGERCHREMLLLTARKKFGAKVEKPHHTYPAFLARLPKGRPEAQIG